MLIKPNFEYSVEIFRDLSYKCKTKPSNHCGLELFFCKIFAINIKMFIY